jgi:SsrA-binding protein
MQTLAQNKKAAFNYELLEKFEAGIELLGFEVKAVRAGKVTLEGSHITVRGGEAYLVGATIAPYQVKNTPESYDPRRNRKLLLTKKEIVQLAETETTKGLTIVPISMYNANRRIKVKIAVARGKKKYDKREAIKRRDDEREMHRTLKENL